MNRKARLFCVALMFFFIVGCASIDENQYIKPDFTDLEILNNEIEQIRLEKKTDPIYSLWQSALLLEETDDSIVHELYAECANYVLVQFYEAAEGEQWFEALRYAQSLTNLNAYVEENLQLIFDDQFTQTIAMVQTAYENQAKLSSAQATFDDTSDVQQNVSMATFVTGVVTIWVDLGIKVEGGVGYVARVIGSGFFIDERGYIVTNHHVISDIVDPEYEGYSRLYIKLSSDPETRIPAKVVGWDKTLDIALLKTEITPPYVYTLGSSENLDIGDPIYAIGSPVGLESTITSGIVSSFDRKLLSTAAVMQIDAAVNTGNSGGPIINEVGEVQGVVFAGMLEYQGLNFAIPVEYLKTILLRLYSGEQVDHSWIGAYGRTYKEFPSDVKGQGVEILYVMPGSPAYYAGLEEGNIITSVNEIPITDIELLQFLFINLIPDTIVSLEYKKTVDSTPSSIHIYIDVRPENPGLEVYNREPSYKMFYPVFGVELVPSSVGNKRKFTVQSIIKGSIADESGFSVHDPVEIVRTEIAPDETAIYAEIFTKKRKSGYMEVNLGVGAPLDSPFFF